MKTTLLLVILLLTLGLWSVPALAGDNVVMQPLPAASQPVDDAQLSQMNGKFLKPVYDVRQAAQCLFNKLPPNVRTEIVWVAQTIRLFSKGPPVR